jgi:L,D-transpeptidase ErfK/SrfK
MLGVAAFGGARAAAEPRRRNDVIGSIGIHVTVAADTLLDVARAHDLGYVELIAANPGIDPWLPGAGTPVVLPTAHVLPSGPRRGLVVNLGDLRLYHFDRDPDAPASYPIGIGREGVVTPIGATSVAGKRRNPTWRPPASILRERPELPRAVPPGPDNPLGAFALDLARQGYAIHGTNKPDGVGRRVSHGCIRLYPEDIERLFARVAVGTPVAIIDEPVKLGWSEGRLFLQAHPTQSQVDEVEEGRAMTPIAPEELRLSIARAAGPSAAQLDWPLISQVLTERRGLPYAVAG